jgi:uncharacterized protein
MCERLLHLLDRIGAEIPITLLVVPHMHRRQRMDEPGPWRATIDTLLSRGCEIALHGLWHVDDGGRSSSLSTFLSRRLLTAGEAEFAALDAATARSRIETGLAVLHRCGWHPRGFVPPAWQIDARACSVLSEFPFEYVTRLGSITRLPDGERLNVPCLTFSARSALRRRVSTRLMTWRLRQLAAVPALRIALHPADAYHSSTLQAWHELLEAALRDRQPVTKSMLVRSWYS